MRHLPALVERLGERLAALGRTAWWSEDCQAALDPALLDPPLEAAWQRVKGLATLPAPAFARGVALARWREARARADDLPRGWVLKDTELLAVALAGPGDPRALAAALPDNPAFVRRHGQAVCEVLLAGEAGPPGPTPPSPTVPTAASARCQGLCRAAAWRRTCWPSNRPC